MVEYTGHGFSLGLPNNFRCFYSASNVPSVVNCLLVLTTEYTNGTEGIIVKIVWLKMKVSTSGPKG